MMARNQLPLDLGLETPTLSRWEFLLDELCKTTLEVITKAGINQPETLAAKLITAIADHLGGQEVYLPRGDKLRLALRDKAILAAIESGVPVWKVAHDQSLSVARIRQILQREVQHE